MFDLKSRKFLLTVENCMKCNMIFNDNRLYIYKNDVNRFVIETIRIF